MIAIINIFCFFIAFIVTWKLVRGRFGIKQLGVICIIIGLNFSLVYLCAKYLGIGFELLPTQPSLSLPETAMKISLEMVEIVLCAFPICYIFEWWYYRKHPDLNSYTGKKKKEAAETDGDGNCKG
jgi:hypothetical protein